MLRNISDALFSESLCADLMDIKFSMAKYWYRIVHDICDCLCKNQPCSH